MKNSITVLAVIIFILITGYAFKEETVNIGVFDTYYDTTYFGIATIIVYLLVLVLLLRYLFQKKQG